MTLPYITQLRKLLICRTTDFSELNQGFQTTYGHFLSKGKWDERKVSQQQQTEALRKADELAVAKRAPIYLSIDEADYWFTNAEKIYSGQITRDILPKVCSKTASCCLDCSVHNPVDIRSVLLLYNTIYLILPSADKFEELSNSDT